MKKPEDTAPSRGKKHENTAPPQGKKNKLAAAEPGKKNRSTAAQPGGKHDTQESSEEKAVHRKNILNDLTGKEWITFTRSWFIHNPAPPLASADTSPCKIPGEPHS
ncbi:MAG: hypothetical protein AB2L14_15135 [Candidatus Xenobiia bacterium LiM19]